MVFVKCLDDSAWVPENQDPEEIDSVKDCGLVL